MGEIHARCVCWLRTVGAQQKQGREARRGSEEQTPAAGHWLDREPGDPWLPKYQCLENSALAWAPPSPGGPVPLLLWLDHPGSTELIPTPAVSAK